MPASMLSATRQARLKILTEQIRSQAERRVVGEADGLGFGIKSHQGGDGAEDFFSDNVHVGGDAAEQRTAGQNSGPLALEVPPIQHLGAFGNGVGK